MRKWIIFTVVYLACVVAVMNQFKVPPVMGILMGQFGVDTVIGGLLMSICSIMGVFLAFPGAVILRRLGPTRSGLAGLGCIVLGCAVGAAAIGITSSSCVLSCRHWCIHRDSWYHKHSCPFCWPESGWPRAICVGPCGQWCPGSCLRPLTWVWA